MDNLLIIGLGNMGYSILKGIVDKKVMDSNRILGIDLDLSKLERIKSDLKIRIAEFHSQDWVEFCKTQDNIKLILAVKPYDVKNVLNVLDEQVVKSNTNKSFHIISICAGLPINTIMSYMSSKAQKVTRIMPNLPLLVAEGASAITHNHLISEQDKLFVRNLFLPLGTAIEIEEKHMDAVTGISGSGPGYVCLFIEALADAGVRAGLSRSIALDLAKQTVLGTAKMLKEQNEHPGVLKDKICSPAGTTIEGVYELEKSGFRNAVMEAVQGVVRRSKELGS